MKKIVLLILLASTGCKRTLAQELGITAVSTCADFFSPECK